MKDGFGRTIEYLRISVTDRCNLRCVYCMPEQGTAPLSHADILSYEQITRLVRIFASLGVRKVRLTGGEPLVRKNLDALVRMLRSVDGIERIALTTNGVLLPEQLPALLSAGLDAVNISIDTTDEACTRPLLSNSGPKTPGLITKLNCVPTERNAEDLAALVAYADGLGVPLRFIELMPIGCGKTQKGLSEAEVLDLLSARFGAWTLSARCRTGSAKTATACG